ncbi:hypothetical protein M422DRAFT_166143 [Sphaerobolus stellatus SS14]|uniref:Rrp15p-domain-containing protein n=1 Tax=Sphaerobolus stellatus (strain SS14) TaxID=990650 RepID=A0A0C9W368_SPHS4|nr:hypothetical protein M422DRAFT_166143 [Sphaerobolus stellatus SS14]
MPPVPPSKRRKVDDVPSDDEELSADEGSLSGDDGDDSGSDGSPNTDTEITNAKGQKSRKTMKRKRRATSPSRFGATLEELLDTKAPAGVAAPLSLKPGVSRRQKEEKLERGAQKILDVEKKEREEKSRIRDVIGGWGMEGERALRKVAQRGVITLFNAIQQSQMTAEEASAAARKGRGTGKPSLPAPDPDRNDKTKNPLKKPNPLGKGKEDRNTGMDQDSFLDLIRAGGVVSKS